MISINDVQIIETVETGPSGMGMGYTSIGSRKIIFPRNISTDKILRVKVEATMTEDEYAKYFLGNADDTSFFIRHAIANMGEARKDVK